MFSKLQLTWQAAVLLQPDGTLQICPAALFQIATALMGHTHFWQVPTRSLMQILNPAVVLD